MVKVQVKVALLTYDFSFMKCENVRQLMNLEVEKKKNILISYVQVTTGRVLNLSGNAWRPCFQK